MFLGRKAIGHAGDVVRHHTFRLDTRFMRCLHHIKTVEMCLWHLGGIVQLHLEQVSHHLLGSLCFFYHLWVAVQVVQQKPFECR